MRCLLVALGLISLLSPAFAADYDLPDYDPPTLRGSQTFVPAFPTYPRWEGLYAGGQLSFSSAISDFSGASQPLVAFSLRNSTVLAQMSPDQWQVLGTTEPGAGGFGGFVGYNFQWDNAIIGLELNYTHASLNADAPSTPLTRNQVVGGLINSVTLTSSGSLHISDFATTRARFGWVIDHFMPYATIGLAFGRADMVLSTVVLDQLSDPNNLIPNPNPPPAIVAAPAGFFSFSQGQAKSGAYLYGFSGGGGLEVGLTQNIFARGEYEFIQWQRLWQIASSMHNLRLGLGVKF